MKPKPNQVGFALILVLWVLSLLILMAGSFALSMRRETAIIANIKNSARALAVAESGIAIAGQMLTLPDKNLQWRTDGSVYSIATEGAEIRVRLLAENGKIDINKANEALLTALFANAPVVSGNPAVNLASAILDWRDKDDLIRLNGAESKEYLEAGLKHTPRNKPFESLDELRLVLGINNDVFAWLAPLVTIYSGQAQVNLANASAEVLYALPDLDPTLLGDYLMQRLYSSQQDLPPPPFPNKLGQPGQNAANPVVSIVSEVLLDDGTAAKINAVLAASQNAKSPFRVLDWQHDSLGGLTLFTEPGADHPVASDWVAKHYVEPELIR